ncbi:helix-turn-helix transcriptional regulator [Pseudonocardia sp. DLS-67]
MEAGPGRDGALLERDREIGALDELIEGAVAGRAAVCGIEGAAGIGKSRLVARARARAVERGMQVLSATASGLESSFSFGVVRQLFAPALRHDEAGLLDGAAAPARVIVGPLGPREQADPPRDPSFASLDGLYWLTVRLSEHRPLLLAIDDLQWCDAPSVRFLSYLRSRFEGLALLVVCGARPAEREAEAAALDTVLGGPATVSLRPRALSEDATSVFVGQRLAAAPAPAFAAECHRVTGGNPLLLEELTKALAAEGAGPDAAHLAMLRDLGPSSVARTVLLRLRRLGPDAMAAAQALAVLGDGADLAAVAALAELDVDRAGRAVASLARAEILQGGLPLGFVHPLVAAAVYRDVLPGERELRHLRAAELLVAAQAPAEQVAGHLLPAPPRGAPWVVEQLAQAAAEASRKGAGESAAAYLGRALAEPPAPERRAELALALGHAELQRNGPATVEHLRGAYRLITDPGQRAIAAGMLGRALLFTGEGDEGIRIVREAAAALPADCVELRQQLEVFELFCVLLEAGDPARLSRLEAHRTLPVAPGTGPRMLAALAAHAWMYAGGPSDAVSELSLAALADGELIAADSALAATYPLTNLVYADRDAEGWWELASAGAHRHGSLMSIAGVTVWRGNALHRRGELVDAERSLRTSLAVTTQWGYHATFAQTYGDAHLAAVLRDRGDLPGARRVLDRSRDPSGGDEAARQWLGSHLELLLAEGAFEDVLAAADDYTARFDHVVRNPVDVPWRSLKALALDQLGRRDEAIELAAAELGPARRWGAPGTVARTLRALGTVERADGIGHLEEAVTAVAGSPARLEHAKALTALGAALRRARRPAEARAPLREALEVATVCGAEQLVERTRAELYAAGGRPRRTALTGVDALTASERRVVSLAAEGRTNREVGEVLYVTPKTVAMHLSNAYRKLGVTSRHELATALADG